MRNSLTLERPFGRSLAPSGTVPTCVHPLHGSENNAFLILVFIRTRHLRNFASSGVTDSTDLLGYSRVVKPETILPDRRHFRVVLRQKKRKAPGSLVMSFLAQARV